MKLIVIVLLSVLNQEYTICFFLTSCNFFPDKQYVFVLFIIRNVNVIFLVHVIYKLKVDLEVLHQCIKMKRIILLISVVVAFCSIWTSATTTPNQVLQVVRDTNGEILRSDSRYFVVTPPVLGGGGGGVTRGPILEAQDANFVCPFQVLLNYIVRSSSLKDYVYFYII